MPGALYQLLSRAKRRRLSQEAAEQAIFGACFGLGGILLLLVLGTQILDWIWPAAAFLAAAGAGIWRGLRRFPSPYQIAQVLDARLTLADTLSTAVYFHRRGASQTAAKLVEAQRESAEALSVQVDCNEALPWRRPRNSWLAATLGVAVLGMLCVRYGTSGTLDLRAPLVSPESPFSFIKKTEPAAAKKGRQRPEDLPAPLAVTAEAEQSRDPDRLPEDALNVVDVPDVNNEAVKGQEKMKGSPLESAAQEEGEQEGEEAGEEAREGAAPAASESGGEEGRKGEQSAKQNISPETQSLLDKMRDAMANLLAKLKIPPRAGEQSAGTQSKKGEQGEAQSRERQGKSMQKGEPGKGEKQGEGAESEEAEAGEAEGQQTAQSGQGKTADKAGEQGDPNSSKSGVGKQEGDKDLRAAEQLEAMGKLSEIFGRRAQSVKGEIMVELSGSKQQQLKTAYGASAGRHAEAGGEISRDEVPLHLQHYVEQYFQELRKAEGPARGAGAAGGKPASGPALAPTPPGRESGRRGAPPTN